MALRRLLSLAGAAALIAVASGPAHSDPGDDTPVTWQITGVTLDALAGLTADGYDVVRYHDGDAVVLGDSRVADRLRADGFTPSFHDTVYKDPAPVTTAADTYYGGYHTVDAHEAHLDQVAAAHPDLATVYDIGDSWLKTQGRGGHDIKAICLTRKTDGDCALSPDSAKPRFTVVAQIHAREVATGEIAWKWIDSLVNGYGTDPAVTTLMDTTEMWVVPIANPDGVDIVASGGDQPVLHRKNANDSDGSCVGVDLNRNSSFEWGADSSNPCAQTYQGPQAASEPEVTALEDLFRRIHPDQRGTNPTDPAPVDARDVFVSLHSYGDYIIVPWGYTEDTSPNDAALRGLGAAMAESNGYLVGTNGDTVGYSTSGTTDDMTYGELGVASFTFEIGDGGWGSCSGFLPAYDCVDSQLWPENRGALMTAAQAAAAPYAA
ncbi:zinc carboxypeptidase [Stackebrandtia albiflava]|uniref:Zinc carboxypeptidase n=1 Tax=Stackebrandtia albiflava TaxID=406432 RepID=A0A562V321_9ACTN|nr:M14 family zinc carboxypeptidase [Stackebrandtia albiflava]TWJ12255.1 zinc carboxypeptidase [Stackebrandtia albiflava]